MPGGGARGGDHRVLVGVQHVRLDRQVRVAAWLSASACPPSAPRRAGPSSSPAAASTNTPEHTLSTRAPRSTAPAQRVPSSPGGNSRDA
ncbi:hypothetical protein SHIRM173S_00102 [Streptomyces hirsutus]